MSAYIVHNDTIDLLITAADAWRVQFADEKDERRYACTFRNEARQLLLDENYRSVNARYDSGDQATAYRWSFVDLDRAAVCMPIAVLVLGSVCCLRYQSCETDDYRDTKAAQFLDAIEATACRKLIGTYDAPWGFTRDWMERTRSAAKERIAATLERH